MSKIIELDATGGAVYLEVIGESIDNPKPPAVWNVVQVLRKGTEIFKYSKPDSQNDRFLVVVDPTSLDGTEIVFKVGIVHESSSPQYGIHVELTQDNIGKKDVINTVVTLVDGVYRLKETFEVVVK